MIVVVGAGPAGLSAAYHLGDDYLLLEREAEVGGLCRSFTLEDCVFDLGGHAFFTRHEHVRALLGRLCAPGLHLQARKASVYSHGTYIPYPFQSNLHGLPIEVVRDCLIGAVERVLTDPPSPSTLDEWLPLAFGEGVERHFLRPYNEKLWAHPLDDVVPAWTGERVAAPSLPDMIDGALRRRPYTDVPNAEVSYPQRGGFAELYRGFLTSVSANLRRGNVEVVDLDERLVITTEGDEYRYDEMISTIPLTSLVRASRPVPDEVDRAAASLAHNSLLLVNLVVGRPAVSDLQRIYVADASVPFHKLVLNSNSSPHLRAQPTFGIQAEVAYSAHKPIEEEGIVDAVIDSVRRIGVLDADESVAASSVRRVPLAYPIYTRNWADAVATLRAFFVARGVHPLGRFGEWAYINSDEAVHRGWNLARTLRGDTSPTPVVPDAQGVAPLA